MAKCTRCRRRKAKRLCPALGQELCSLCCGRHRNREIRCPVHCPFLAQHAPYQDQRSQEKDGEEFPRDERLVWLAFHIERPLRILAERFPEFSDEDAVLALEYARDQAARAQRLIVVPGATERPRHEAGEAVFQSLEACRFEGRIILSGRQSFYSHEEKLKVLDIILTAARSSARENPRGRSFLSRLVDRHRRAEEREGSGKRLTSG